MRLYWTRLVGAAIVVLGLMGTRSVSLVSAATTVHDCPASQSALSADITNAGAGGTVVFTCTAATTIPFTTTITPTQNIALDGSSSQPVTFDGGGSVQLFSVHSGTKLDLTQLTLTRGSVTGYGGAINSSGTVHITGSTLSDDSASSGGGAIYNGSGTLTVENSTLTRNSATQNGGAIFNNVGTTYVMNSTLAHNTATYGGAIFANTSGTVHFSNSTVAHNTSTYGGAIFNGATLTIKATIVASNTGAGCGGAAVTDEGYNLTENVQNCTMTNSTDLANTNPDLKALGNHGGPTETMALDAKSKAIDHVPQSSGFCPPTDQRGVSRFDDAESACDVGAYEHVDHMRVEFSVAGGQYTTYIDGADLLVPSTLDWRAKTPHGDHSGAVAVTTSAVHIPVFTHPCPSGHITVDASAKEATGQDLTAHYEGDVC